MFYTKYVYKSYIFNIYMYKEDLSINNLQWVDVPQNSTTQPDTNNLHLAVFFVLDKNTWYHIIVNYLYQE